MSEKFEKITIEELKSKYEEVRINLDCCDCISVPISCFKKFEANVYTDGEDYTTNYIKMEIENNNNMWYYAFGNCDKTISPIDKLNKSNTIVSVHLIKGNDEIEINLDWFYSKDYSKNLAQVTKLIDYKTLEILSDVKYYYKKRRDEIKEELESLTSELDFYNSKLKEIK